MSKQKQIISVNKAASASFLQGRTIPCESDGSSLRSQPVRTTVAPSKENQRYHNENMVLDVSSASCLNHPACDKEKLPGERALANISKHQKALAQDPTAVDYFLMRLSELEFRVRQTENFIKLTEELRDLKSRKGEQKKLLCGK